MQLKKTCLIIISVLLILFIQTTLSRVSKTHKNKLKTKLKTHVKRSMKDDIKNDKNSIKHTKRPSENNGFNQEAKHVRLIL
jgi:hypothetical protein